MSKFAELWKNNNVEKNFEMMDGVKDIVDAMDYGMLEEKAEEVEKPGNSIHSEKWDACVRDVKTQRVDVDAYAVCTAQLGEASFKSIENMSKAELKIAMGELKKAIDIEDAGPIPYSLLARQDMKNRARLLPKKENKENKEFSENKQEKTKLIDDGRPVPATNEEAMDIAIDMVENYADYVAIVACLVDKHGVDQKIASEIVRILMTQDREIGKGVIESTGKKLEDLTEEAHEASNEEEKNALVENIKNIQVKRQKAFITQRKKEEPKEKSELALKIEANQSKIIGKEARDSFGKAWRNNFYE